MGRRLTTGKFDTRGELIENIHIHYKLGKSRIDIANLCGVSPPTVTDVIQHTPAPKAKSRSVDARGAGKNKAAGKTTAEDKQDPAARLAKAGGSEPQLEPIPRRKSPTQGVNIDRPVARKKKSLYVPTATPEQPATIGWWCWCFQDTEHVKAPYQGQILSATGNYWKLKVGRHTVTVNRGACSTHPYPRRK